MRYGGGIFGGFFFEQLVIQNAFSVQLLAGRLSVDEAEQSIKEGLDVTSARSDALFGDLLTRL